MSGKDDTEDKTRYQVPYSAKHPIPTVRKFREELADRQDKALEAGPPAGHQDHAQEGERNAAGGDETADRDGGEDNGNSEGLQDTSQIDPGASDPRKRRKNKKAGTKERAEREVTDPVTHLPVTIQDFTDEALKNADLDGASPQSPSVPHNASDDGQDQALRGEEKRQLQERHDVLTNRFPPPEFDALRLELSSISNQGVTVGLSSAVLIIIGAVTLERYLRGSGNSSLSTGGLVTSGFILATTAGILCALVFGLRDWMAKRVSRVFEDEVWDAQRKLVKKQASRHEKETTVWLNSLMEAVWPLVNPDLFTGLGDTLEDVMQASLPKLIRMVSVDDIGQGSEALRILGVRWLPTGAATKSVTNDGDLTANDDHKTDSSDSIEENQNEDEADQVAQGMAAEEGDFINLEVAFAYRSRASTKSLKEKTKDMHLYLAFYLAGNIKIPVWVSLQGIIGTMRLRLQLTPDPPFFALCTITFLGQPKVDLSCVPISKHALNVMDVPFISSFVQTSVDAAVAEYVAPKSLTLDLKDMLAGEDFKKDTAAMGVIVVHIRRGYDFKIADNGIPLIKDGTSDPYVSVGWAKFGKVLWSSRIIVSEMEPYWDETCYVVVTPEELNVEERLRIQLWDSDKYSADDDLGRIEVDLKEIMTSDESNGRMSHRTDGFRALKSGDNMPGKLEWSVGYYSKTRIQQCQLDSQTHDPEVRSMDQLKDKVDRVVEHKLREAMIKKGGRDSKQSVDELKQQKAQELSAEQDAMIISAPPPDGYRSGLFALQIHNITGLELEKLSKDPNESQGGDGEEAESGEGLPSAYCTIIINHKKTFKTRTKPQNSKPFYNAGCERFIRDWRDCEVFVTVRDSRLDEEDALLGIVHLPLYKIFQERSQVMGTWPLAGGIGHGKIRLSMVWRSVQLQAPERMMGWDNGTVEVQPQITGSGLPPDLASCKIKLYTDLSSGKFYADKGGEEQTWKAKHSKSLKLGVTQRYVGCLRAAFKSKGITGEDVVAFCVLWLKEIPDEEEQELELPVWKGDYKRAIANCLDEPGEKVGTLKLKLNFWAGLGGAHSSWASKDKNLRDVVEVISTAQENLDVGGLEKRAGIVNEEASSASDNDSSDGADDVPDGSAGDKQGPIDKVRDYKRREKALHRKHRGIMQWKIPRSAKWMKHQVDGLGDKVTGVFDRKTRHADIETEV